MSDRPILKRQAPAKKMPPPLFPDTQTLHDMTTMDTRFGFDLKIEVTNVPSFRHVRVWLGNGDEARLSGGPTVYVEVQEYADPIHKWEFFGRYDGNNPPYSLNSFWTADLGIDDL